MSGSERKHKSGVVFIAKVPKFMQPSQAKQYFENFGFPVGRLFFTSESQKQKLARKKRGGDVRKTLFLEGWIEFVRKRDAKEIAETFNGRSVEGNASYKNELWALRYLHGFKFDHLMEEKVYKKAMHERQVKKELSAAKEDTQAYLEQVTKAKRMEYAMAKKRERGEEVQEFERKISLKEVHEDTNAPSESLLKHIIAPDVVQEEAPLPTPPPPPVLKDPVDLKKSKKKHKKHKK